MKKKKILYFLPALEIFGVRLACPASDAFVDGVGEFVFIRAIRVSISCRQIDSLANQKPTEADQKTFATTVDSGCDDYYELLQSFSFMSVSAKSFSAKRAIKLLLVCVAIFYLGICIFMALIQRSLLYVPRVYDSARVDQR